MIKYNYMSKIAFIKEAKAQIARESKLGLVKLVKDASRLGLRECKCDVVDELIPFSTPMRDAGTPNQVAEKLWIKMKEVMDREFNNG